MRLPSCPICNSPVDPAKTRSMPFCSERCRQIDLGRWLNEDYGLPIEPEKEEPDDYADKFDDDN